jgi:hypothetical protein
MCRYFDVTRNLLFIQWNLEWNFGIAEAVACRIAEQLAEAVDAPLTKSTLCSVLSKFQKFYKILRHIKSLNEH